MFCMLKKKKVYPDYVSKHNSNHKEDILSMISKAEKQWHYLEVKKLSALLRRITFKHYGDFYGLNCYHSFRTKNKLQSYKKVCEKKDFWSIIIPYEDTKIFEFNQYQKYEKAPFIIFADLDCIIVRINKCKNNPENSSTTKVTKHIPSGFSMSTISPLGIIENQHDLYRGKDCMKKFREFLRKHAMKIINLK